MLSFKPMRFFRIRKVRLSLEEQEARRTTRSAGIRGILFVSGIIFLCFVAFLGLTLVLLPMLDCRAEERLLNLKRLQLKQKQEEEKTLYNRSIALEKDQEYNETVASDKGIGKPGMRYFQFPESPEQKQEEPIPVYAD